MNKSQLSAHVAAETSVTRATADRLVDAVFSAIADALARDETVAIAGYPNCPVACRSGRCPGQEPDGAAPGHDPPPAADRDAALDHVVPTGAACGA